MKMIFCSGPQITHPSILTVCYKARLGVLVLGECSMHYNVCVLCGI